MDVSKRSRHRFQESSRDKEHFFRQIAANPPRPPGPPLSPLSSRTTRVRDQTQRGTGLAGASPSSGWLSNVESKELNETAVELEHLLIQLGESL